MIKRYPGSNPTRSKAVAHNGLVYTVATGPNKSAPLYEQTREALAAISPSDVQGYFRHCGYCGSPA